METILIVLILWFIASVPAAILAGKFASLAGRK